MSGYGSDQITFVALPRGGRLMGIMSSDEARGGHMQVLVVPVRALSLLTEHLKVSELLALLADASGEVPALFARSDRPLEIRWGYLPLISRVFRDEGSFESFTEVQAQFGLSLMDSSLRVQALVLLATQRFRAWQQAAMEEAAQVEAARAEPGEA